MGFPSRFSKRLIIDWLRPALAAKTFIESPWASRASRRRRTISAATAARRSTFVTPPTYAKSGLTGYMRKSITLLLCSFADLVLL